MHQVCRTWTEQLQGATACGRCCPRQVPMLQHPGQQTERAAGALRLVNVLSTAPYTLTSTEDMFTYMRPVICAVRRMPERPGRVPAAGRLACRGHVAARTLPALPAHPAPGCASRLWSSCLALPGAPARAAPDAEARCCWRMPDAHAAIICQPSLQPARPKHTCGMSSRARASCWARMCEPAHTCANATGHVMRVQMRRTKPSTREYCSRPGR